MNMNMNGQASAGYGANTLNNAYNSGMSAAYKLPNTNSTGNSNGLVSLSGANHALLMADDNLDGVIDQQELAMAAYQLLGSASATEEDQSVGRLFATLVQGGADGKGLFPDLDRDGALSSNELALLAKGDDDASTISTNDFQFAFGKQYTQGGNNIALDGLKGIATGNTGSATGNAGTATGNNNATVADGQQTPQQSIERSTLSLLGLIINYLQQQSTGSTSGSAPIGQTSATQTPAATASDEQQAATGQQNTQQAANPMATLVSILGTIIKLMMVMMGGRQQLA